MQQITPDFIVDTHDDGSVTFVLNHGEVPHEFPWWPGGKECICQAGDMGLTPGSGRTSGEGNGTPLQYSCWKVPWTEQSGGLQSMGLNNSET